MPPLTGDFVSGEERYYVTLARYARDMYAVRIEKDGSGLKTRAMRLAHTAVRGRWSNREKAYIMSATKVRKLHRYITDGWDASPITGEIEPPHTH